MSHRPVSPLPPLRPGPVFASWVSHSLVLLPHENLLTHGGEVWIGLENMLLSDTGARLCFREGEKYLLKAFWLNADSSAHLHPTPTVASLLSTVVPEPLNGSHPSIPTVENRKAHDQPAPAGPCKNYRPQQWPTIVSLWASGSGRQSEASLAHQQSLGLSR